jgi:hypothetical protein
MFMNKSLLRKLRSLFLSVTPQDGRHLVEAFDLLEATAKKSSMRFYLVLRAFTLITRHRLKNRCLSESQLFQEISKFEIIVSAWLKEWAALWATFFSPAILLLLFLETTLDSKRLPERQKFVFEEIKQSLWDRHWPPQRQRCDFIPAPAIN